MINENIELNDQLMAELESTALPELALFIRDMKAMVDGAAEVKARYQKIYDYVTINVVPAAMDEQGIETLKVTGVGRLQQRADIRCSCPAANRQALEDWLMDHDQDALISTTVNSSTLKAFVKEQMKEGGEYPEELLKIEPYSRATVVKA